MSDTINNSFYGDLSDRWYVADNDPVALLRAEAKFRNPWVKHTITRQFRGKVSVLDIGCGAGLLTNFLADSELSIQVTGLDAAAGALDTARRYNRSPNKVNYMVGDAMKLPFADRSFEVVSLMDFLEHVDKPEAAVKEAARVLKPGGLLFFHTFNRNFLSWLIAIKGVEWVVPNVPKDMHVIDLFITPEELQGFLYRSGLKAKEVFGTRPIINRSFWRLLLKNRIDDNFAFKRTSSLLMGYLGYAQKS